MTIVTSFQPGGFVRVRWTFTLAALLLLTGFAGLVAQPGDTAALDLQVKLSLQQQLAVQLKVLGGQSSVYAGWMYALEPATEPEHVTEQEQGSTAWSAWLSLRYPWLVLGALAKNGSAFQLLQPFAAEMRPLAGDKQPLRPATASTAEYSGLAVGRNVGLFRINRFRLLERGGGQSPEHILNGLSGLWLDFDSMLKRTAERLPDGQTRAYTLPDQVRMITALQPNTVRPASDWFAAAAWPGWRMWHCVSLLKTDLNSALTVSFGQQLDIPGTSAIYWRTQYQLGPPGLRLNADWAVSSGTYRLPAFYSASTGVDGGYTISGASQGRLLPLYHLQLSGHWKALPWLNLRLLFRQEQASVEQAALASLHVYPDISTSIVIINLSSVFTAPAGSLQAALSAGGTQLHNWETVIKAKLSSPLLPGLVLAGAGYWQEAGYTRLDMEFAWSGVFSLPADGQRSSGSVVPGKNSFNPAGSLLLRHQADAVYIKPRVELALHSPAGIFTLQAGFSDYWQITPKLLPDAVSAGAVEGSQAAMPEANPNKPVPELSCMYQLRL